MNIFHNKKTVLLQKAVTLTLFFVTLLILIAGLYFFFTNLGNVRAAVGTGIASLSGVQTTSGVNLNSTSPVAMVWNTTDIDPNFFSYSAGTPTRLTVTATGDYLLAFSLPTERADSNNNSRTRIQAEVHVNGVKSPVGVARSAFAKDVNNHTETSDNFHVLLENITAGNYIEIFVQGVTNVGSGNVVVITGLAKLYVEKISVTENIFNATATRTVASTDLNGTSASPLQWNEGRKNSGYTHSNTTNSHNITIVTAGDYLVLVNIPLSGNVTRGNVRARVLLGGAQVPGGQFKQGYIRNNQGDTSSSIHWSGVVRTVSANQILSIDTTQEASSGTITTGGDNATIYIQKIPSSDIYFGRGTTLTGGSDWNPVTKQVIRWTTDTIIDSSVYTHSTVTNPHQVTVKEAGDYLLVYNNSFSSTASNTNAKITVEVDGTPVSGAETKTHYIRNSGGHNESSGSLVFLLENLTANSVITVSTIMSAGSGTVTADTDALLMLWYKRLPVIDVTIGATPVNQSPVLDIPSTNQYVGGAFTITNNTTPRNVTGITITENGTVDAQTNLKNIKLYYELDTTAPYDCAEETYEGTEAQFGSTVSGGFSGANGTAVFTGSVAITTTATMCVYTVLDVQSGATTGQTLEIEISNPSTQVSVSAGVVTPAIPIFLFGTTSLETPSLSQIHYHWRNDNGSEVTATSATSGTEDTLLSNVAKSTIKRLRIEISNTSQVTVPPKSFRIEYGMKDTTCSAISAWADVGAPLGDWDMADSANLTNGENTTNISVGVGGVTDENSLFKTPNGGVLDTTSQSSLLSLANGEFVELEYALEATASASAGSTYCFRVTDAGVPLTTYGIYAQASVKAESDFFIQRGVTTIDGTTATITSGIDYVAPSALSGAFIRLTNTHMTGAGRNAGGGNQNADDVTVFIQNPQNLLTSITFERGGSANNTLVSWEIIEYIGPVGGDNEIIVRDQNVATYESGSTTVSTSAISSVANNNKVVAFITGQGNIDTGRNNYNTTLSTAAWNSSNQQIDFTRGEANGTVVNTSWALVEFTGINWSTQRSEHTYTQSGITETESITSVNSMSRAFLHVQKRVGAGLNGIDDFGHEVWLSGTNTISFQLQNTASTPNEHISVVWIIENTQTSGTPMIVTRTNGSRSGGPEPSADIINIGKTLANISNASLFVNDRVSGSGTAFPRPMMGARILNTTQYELWISDTGQTITYRTEIVEWPTATLNIIQNYFRFYVDDGNLKPSDAWPPGGINLGENTSITANDAPPSSGDILRIRTSLLITGASINASSQAFKLQYGTKISTCGVIVAWSDVGGIGGSEIWRGFNATPTDGTPLSGNPPTGGDLLLSISDRAGTFEEANPSAPNPYSISIGEDMEYDWVIQDNGATEETSYCFRIVKSDGSLLNGYDFYPTLITGGFRPKTQTWRIYDDETNETPTIPLAGENISPVNVSFDNIIKLRITTKETSGASGANARFKIQFSDNSSFSSGVFDVVEISSCGVGSLWCYADSAGVDNVKISTKILSDADACVGSVGNGCGTHNESGGVVSGFTHPQNAATEYEFSVKHAGARANTAYFFRLFDVNTGLPVPLNSGATYPSLSTEGAALTFSISGLSALTVTEGITTDIPTTPTSIPFGSLPIDVVRHGAQRVTISTNATEGYQVLVYSKQGLLSGTSEIPPVTGTNASPSAWAVGCSALFTGCFGYHSGDDVLAGGSTRFVLDDSFASFSSTPLEIIYSGGPVTNEVNDMVYKILAKNTQPAGLYETTVVYIITPVF